MSVSLRCQGRGPRGQLCRGHCGNHAIPTGYHARFVETLERCPEPDGTIASQCARCRRWNRWELVVSVLYPKEPAA